MVFLWCKLRIYYAAWSKTYNIWIHCITGRINSAVAYPVQYLVKSFMYPQTTTPPHTMGAHQLSMSQTVAKLGSNCNMTTKCFRSNQQQFDLKKSDASVRRYEAWKKVATCLCLQASEGREWPCTALQSSSQKCRECFAAQTASLRDDDVQLVVDKIDAMASKL